ncbi:transcriptional regulator [uncultured Tateyamaria sp.]|uniref:helix-turn-helix transcriptional regulator n=1 Tax=uncultured Tateyamaria sp. TaxID=455651 RepID=UPI002607C30A|nr:transcriptional regulator [uncultured Tateyamaria sp.]
MAKLLNIDELCDRLGNRSKKTIHRDIVSGTIPRPVKMGGRNYWHEDVIDQFIADLPVGGPTLKDQSTA